MNDSQKTKKQLIEELAQIRQQLATAASSENKPQKNTPESTESDNIFYKAFLSSPDMFIIGDLTNGIYIEVNDSFVENTGYSREELIGHSVDEFTMWVYQEELEKMTRLLAEQGKLTNEEFSFRTKSGEIRLWLCSAEIVNINGTDRMIAVATDITERKKLEENLRYHADLMQNVSDAIISTDLEYKITSWNKAAELKYGWREDEVIGKNLADIIKPEYPNNNLEDIMEILRKDGIWQGETIHETKEEEKLNILASTSLVKDENGNGKRAVAVFTDITERKRVEDALRESEEKFSKAFRSSPDRIVITSLYSGKIIEVNDSYLNFTGYTREEVIGRTTIELNAWVNPKNREKLVKKLVKQGRLYNEEACLRLKSGEVRTSLFSAELIDINGEQCMISIATDITERKRAEEALRESEAELQSILRAAPIGIALVQDQVAIWVNDYMSTLTGYSGEELVGLCARKLCTSDEEFLRVEELKVQNIELYGKSEIESKLVCKNGKIIDILVISTPLDSEDPSAGEIAMMMDITERNKAQEQEREAKNLRELDKLRTELLANVSHELRTPLASIKGFTTVLTDYDKKLTTEEKREYLEIIDHNTDRLSELIEQLLVMSRLGAGMLTIDKSPSDINKLCQEVISEAKIRSPEYQFKLDMPTRLPRVNIDTKRIRKVLDNLIDNAVKHSSAGTDISIVARKSNGEIIVTVTDEGTGISRKDKPRVFDRMYHAKRNHKPGVTGAGLGLSICKGLIEAHQGRIWIESEEGKGTRCFFTLPTYNNRGVSHGKKDKGQYHSVRRG